MVLDSTRVDAQSAVRRRTSELQALRSVALIASYPPRKCGIAAFTADLLHALSGESPITRVASVAVNDTAAGYEYPPEVEFEIAQNRLADYRRAADYLNANAFEVVSLQHEYGLYGGVAGDHVVKLLGELRMPVVATLHTILREPSADERRVLLSLARICDRLVVMNETGGRFLCQTYDLPEEKVAVIPHGVPDTPFLDSAFYKDQFGAAGKKVILTFGLLSPNKGLEAMIRALPQIVARHPDVIYIVLGATHPRLKRTAGEAYRLELQRLARRVGVDDHVIFRDEFVELPELCAHLGAADVYVTPYLNASQIVSGTLSYAMATGKAVVSTPYWHAEEALAEGRGRLVPFNDPDALAREIVALLENDAQRNAMRKRAYQYARPHVWKEVARRYLALFLEVRERARRVPPLLAARTVRRSAAVLPELNFTHLVRLTDDVGVLQHATYNIPDRAHGYCVDDNARALLVTQMAQAHVSDPGPLADLGRKYLSFVQHAFNPETGRLRNLMSYDRRWLTDGDSEDSHGRALWALGVTVLEAPDADDRRLAAELFRRSLPALREFGSIRASAHALLGIEAFLQWREDAEVQTLRDELATRLLARYKSYASDDWPWLEQRVTYANGTIPHVLIAAGISMARPEMVDAGLYALRWLADLQLDSGHLVPIGNRGWYPRGGQRARYDQQPIEAASMIPACIQAYRASDDRAWLTRAETCFRWFLGDNDLGTPVYIDATGGCCDGLEPGRLNPNRGAESTLAWLYSLIQMYELQAEGVLGWAAEEG